MKKKETLQKLKSEYEKVYEHPLKWCPLSGYLPEREDIDIKWNNKNFGVISKCLEIIENSRNSFFDLGCYTQKYISLPDIESPVWPYKNRIFEFKAIRLLFRNLDYLKLKAIYNFFSNEHGIPVKPIGRTSNRHKSFFGSCAEGVFMGSKSRLDSLLAEAQKITNKQIDYNYDAKRLYGLYIILEAWILLTSMLFNPKRYESEKAFSEINEKLFYIQDLYLEASHFEILERQDAQKKWNEKNNSSRGGSNKSNPISTAIQEILKKNNRATDMWTWDYFKNNHKGKNNSFKCNENRYLVYWKKDNTGQNPEGFLVAFDGKKKKELRINIFKSFCRNFNKAKSVINNKIKQ